MHDTDALIELMRLQRVLDAVSPPVCYLDSNLRYVYLNEAYLRWFSCSHADAHGNHLSSIIGDVAFEYNRPALELALSGETVTCEAHLPCVDGQMRFVRAEMIPDYDENGDVMGVIGIVTDLHERKQLEDALREAMERMEMQSLQDSLTGLGNHRAFLERLTEAERAFERDQSPCALLFFDVDSFKSFNDTFGHPAGDEVLRQVASLFKHEIRPGDLVARYGGEEFAVLLRGADETEAMQCAERLRQAVHKACWPLRDVTVSGGVACFSGATPCGQSVLQLADNALYHAKKCGKNRVCQSSYEPPILAPQNAGDRCLERNRRPAFA
ncbi:diguanylate cyclase DosC [Abditibacteriota bacterium]|nr:diguanylate cyclase DosC [Abditibacteriota bacterium]